MDSSHLCPKYPLSKNETAASSEGRGVDSSACQRYFT